MCISEIMEGFIYAFICIFFYICLSFRKVSFCRKGMLAAQAQALKSNTVCLQQPRGAHEGEVMGRMV